MTYLNSWVANKEDPVSAAIRSDITAARNVADAAHNYQTALAQGDNTQIKYAQQAFRQAWESDVRRHGGHPEDFIPDYHNATLEPGIPYGFFGQSSNKSQSILQLFITIAIIYVIWMLTT